jgi:response regulator RpfG family c-di-GMP phosphodiesterase
VSGGGPRALVVTRRAEDGESLCAELQEAGYRTVLALDGRSALGIAARHPPALIVQDIVLADMDGASMIGRLRSLPGVGEVPAIGLTSVPPVTANGPGGQSYQELLIKPVDPGELIAAVNEQLAPAGEPVAEPAGERPHILLAEDNSAERRLMVLRLRDAGYEVTAAADSAEALELARRVRPDIIVSDVLMPRMDGFELARRLRSDERLGDVPVVLTSSAFIDHADEALAAAAGARMLVPRSPTMLELLAAVAECLASAGIVQPAPGEGGPPLQRRAVERRLGERMAVHLDHQLEVNAQLRHRLAAQSIELAVLAGMRAGVLTSPVDEPLDEVLARCAEVAGFGCGVAYLVTGSGRPALQGRVGFVDTAELEDFFGDPGLLLEAIAAAGRGVARLPSPSLSANRVAAVLRRAELSVLLVAPVFDGEQMLGAIVLGSPNATVTADQEAFIVAVAAQLGQSLARVNALYALSRSQLRTIERLTRAVEFRDAETANHTKRVSRYCALLATLSGVDDQRGELIATGSMMHDVGKIGIPDRILLKPGRLNAQERDQMERHAEYGRTILAGEHDPLLDLAAQIAWTHHERWDGQGYPRRLVQDEIPLEGRIVAICDVFDALTSNRVYRPAIEVPAAVQLMLAGRGPQFDPQLLDLFLDALPHVLRIRERIPDPGHERGDVHAGATR